MYDDRPVIIALIFAVIVLVVIVELVRQRKLKEEYSLLWLLTGVALIVLAMSRQLLDIIAAMIGVAYPPSLLFLMAFGFMFIILLHFSTVVSRLSDENKKLAQQIAILRYELRRIEEGDAGAEEGAVE
ncbi:MAG: DUF2304 domain-containing protein [Anaerolineae bacterium]|nr:DUF2304 domain-containing protein [Anaerolineae bacterium]